MNWYLKVIKHYADFSGRARRKEYWMFALFNVIFVVGAMLTDKMLGTTFKINGVDVGYGWIYTVYCLAILLPSLAVCVRRLHDIGKSGFYYFIWLIPVIGWIILIVWFCKDSQSGENEYGLNPKES